MRSVSGEGAWIRVGSNPAPLSLFWPICRSDESVISKAARGVWRITTEIHPDLLITACSMELKATKSLQGRTSNVDSWEAIPARRLICLPRFDQNVFGLTTWKLYHASRCVKVLKTFVVLLIRTTVQTVRKEGHVSMFAKIARQKI